MSREIPAIFIRSCIEEAWDATSDNADASFLQTLKDLRRGQYTATKDGFLVENSSQSGNSTSIHIPVSPADRNRITPFVLQTMWQEVVENYRLIALAENYGPNEDEGFLTALLGQFPTVTDLREDFTLLNMPTYGPTL